MGQKRLRFPGGSQISARRHFSVLSRIFCPLKDKRARDKAHPFKICLEIKNPREFSGQPTAAHTILPLSCHARAPWFIPRVSQCSPAPNWESAVPLGPQPWIQSHSTCNGCARGQHFGTTGGPALCLPRLPTTAQALLFLHNPLLNLVSMDSSHSCLSLPPQRINTAAKAGLFQFLLELWALWAAG